VKVIAEDLHTKVKRHTNSGYFTMVAIDDNGKPAAVPPLETETEFERKLYEAAVMRKEMREEAVRRNKEITADIPDYNTDVTG